MRFNDELLNGVMHSKEAFDDIVEDLDLYEKFTSTHPDFINNKCVLAKTHIKDTYLKCEREASFL